NLRGSSWAVDFHVVGARKSGRQHSEPSFMFNASLKLPLTPSNTRSSSVIAAQLTVWRTGQGPGTCGHLLEQLSMSSCGDTMPLSICVHHRWKGDTTTRIP